MQNGAIDHLCDSVEMRISVGNGGATGTRTPDPLLAKLRVCLRVDTQGPRPPLSTALPFSKPPHSYRSFRVRLHTITQRLHARCSHDLSHPRHTDRRLRARGPGARVRARWAAAGELCGVSVGVEGEGRAGAAGTVPSARAGGWRKYRVSDAALVG